jgi:uroporphyrinogen-III synthase
VRLLVTRPEPDGERTAAALRGRAHDVVLAPLLRIETIQDAEIGGGPWSALVITSANAVHAIEAHARRAALSGLPVFAVGRRTAAAARAAGFSDVMAAGGNVRELAASICQRARPGGAPLLYLAGEDTSGDLAGDLAAQGLTARAVVVYRAVKAGRFPPAAGAALAAGEIEGVLHFSGRSAEAYIECARAAGLLDPALQPLHYCLSRQVAAPLLAAGAGRVRIAPHPDEAALLELVDSTA